MYKKIGGLVAAISGLVSAGSAKAAPWQGRPNSPKHSRTRNFSTLFLMPRHYCASKTPQLLQRLVSLGRARTPT
jgi:hypothetical protein